MSAETLRRAAKHMREDAATHVLLEGDPFILAVADWLDDEAADCKSRLSGLTFAPREHPLAVARAYLGESA